jgi:hypothetical protein
VRAIGRDREGVDVPAGRATDVPPTIAAVIGIIG